MKYSVVIDSVGCLPEAEVKRRGIKVLPLKIQLDDVEYYDSTEEKALIAIHEAGRISVKSKAHSVTPTQDDIRKFILQRVALECDLAVCETIGTEFTQIYPAYKLVSNSVSADAKEIRAKNGITTPFRMTTIDSRSMGAGQGLIAIYSDDLLSSGMPYNEFVPIIDDFKTLVKTFTIVNSPLFMRHRAKMKGNKTVSLPVAAIANALDFAPMANSQNGEIHVIDTKVRGFNTALDRVFGYCEEQVHQGLVAPLINVAYAGDPQTLLRLNSFKRLQHVCDEKGVALYRSVMSLASTINMGPGAASISVAPMQQDGNP